LPETGITPLSPARKIPMTDLAAQHLALEDELLEGFAAIFASGRFVLGETVAAFESALAKTCDRAHAIGCNSGTDALWLALRGLGIGPGDAVLCPAYSFFATGAAIVQVGATPIFCDIDPVTLNLDPEDAIRRAEAVPNLRAVMTVDLFGRICELGPLADYCCEREIPIIEDAAQAIGATDARGNEIGHRTRVACLSFYPTKNLGALGDAGGIVTDDPDLADRIRRLRVHGECAPGVYDEIGINSRMDALQAVALSIKLRHLEGWTRARRQLALHYDALFAERGATPSSAPTHANRLPLRTPAPCAPPERHTYHRYVVRIEAPLRGPLIESLRAEGIATEIYYPRGMHTQPALAKHVPPMESAAAAPLPETERACREALALPLYPEMGLERIERVVGAVTQALMKDA
jgi:dTDP-4-amino-4,6-dideoxygalactose transaminase